MQFCPSCGAALPARPPVTCEQCGARHYRNAKPCAGALAVRGGKLLLVERASEPWRGRWDIPGGFCEFDEHPEETAVREVREETGLEVRVTGFLGMWLDRYPHPDVASEDVETTLNLYFHADVTGGEERPAPEEVTRLGWFAPDELPSREETAFPEHAPAVLAAWRASRESGAPPSSG